MNRNHEGYHDPTAYTAIRRVGKRKKPFGSRLTYRIDELESFRAAARRLCHDQ